MASINNRKRTKKKPKDNPLWGDLFTRVDSDKELTGKHLYPEKAPKPVPVPIPVPTRAPAPTRRSYPWRSLWNKLNVWSIAAITVFLVFSTCLYWLVVNMWIPQDMRDIAGYTDKGVARDLTAIVRNANGADIIFTEAEINRYLRDTCRIRQDGVMAIFSRSEGVALRIHDGYAEFIIDSIIGSSWHQTTAVHLSFSTITEHGRQSVKVSFCGGEPMMGNMPRGGSIGRVPLPQHYMRMLQPSLESLLTCYKEFFDTIREQGYCPTFTEGKNGHDSTVRLSPMPS